MFVYLLIITAGVLTLSFLKDWRRTIAGLKIAGKKTLKILGPLLSVMLLASLVLFLIPETEIARHLAAGNKFRNLALALFSGSLTMLPGFIAFPLGGILRQNNVPYMIISGFTSTLMLVGVLTFPVEKRYFGTRVALARNLISFLIALLVSLITGLVFRELGG